MPSSSIIRELLAYAERPGLLSLAGGLPASDLLPAAEVAAATAEVLAAGSDALQYAPTEGVPSLRRHLATTLLGDPGAGERVLVTAGSQQGLDLLARTLQPGDAVCVDDPCYLGARQAFDRPGVRVVAVPVDREGLRVEQLERALHQGLRPRLVYTVVHHHNPTGGDLTPERRARLVMLAERYGFLLVEDGAYRELAFDGARRPVGAASSDAVVSLGTVSKTLAPGLRVGWILAPPALVGRLAVEKQAVDLQSSTLAQYVVAALLGREDWFAAHLARVRAEYRRRCDALVDALLERFGGDVEVVPPAGGLFLWARLPGVDTGALLGPALDAGVAFVPGGAFAITAAATDRARLSFATLPPAELGAAVDRLRSVVPGVVALA